MPHRNNNPILAGLALGYFLLLVYASLMPYDFTFAIDFSRVFDRALNHWPINPHARISGSDIVSNLILYIPLGFLVAAHLNNKWTSWFKCCFFAAIFCSLTSLAVETAQAATLSRTASATDWLTNTVSGLTGSYFGARYGRQAWKKWCNWFHERRHNNPIDIFTLFFAALIAADALTPFLPTLLLSQIWRSLKTSKFNIIDGFSQHPWHWWLVNHIFIYMILMILITHWGSRNKKQLSRFHAATISFLFAATLELGKLFIASRVMNLSNLLTNGIGILLAVLVLKFWKTKLHRNSRLNLGILALIIYVLYLGWTPFNFQFNLETLTKKLPTWVEMLPFYHYAMGASLNHIRLFLQTVLLSGTLIYFLRLRYPQLDKYRFKFALSLLLTCILGLSQEGGQLFLPTRTPSMTDVYCYMIGGVLAILIPQIHVESGSENTKSATTRID